MHGKTMSMAMAGVAALALAAGSAEAQGRRDSQGIPPGHLPPAGMCRIWLDDVPPGRQPAPTSCAEAERRAPRDARVIYGSGTSRDGRWERDGGRADGRWDRDGRYEDDRGRTRTDERERSRTGTSGSSARSGDYCLDRNRDGYCDDVYRDGRTGSSTRYPSRLPMMPTTRQLERGDWRASGDAWGLRDRSLRVRYEDRDRNGRPELITWVDARNRPVQRWADTNRDGRADRIAVYENGRVVRTIG